MTLVDLNEFPVKEIIDKSGLMRKIKEKQQEQSLSESIFTACLLTIPLVICHWLFDYLVHLQFGFEKEITFERFLNIQSKASLAIFGFALVTDIFKKSKSAQVLYFLVSLYLASKVILIVNDDGTFGALQKTPGLICSGIILVIQMELGPACAAVILGLGFNYKQEIMGILNYSGLQLGKPEL